MINKYLTKIWPVLVFFLVWFIFSSPYFLKGLVPYPSKYQVTFFQPWSHLSQWWGPVKNNAMPDVIDQIYPWKHFTIEWMKKGQIPFWNPNNFSGNPHVANFQSAVFSPFNLLYFVLPFIDAWSIIVLLQPLLAGLFTYLFLKELKVSKVGSLLGGIVFAFCGFNVVWMAYGTLTMAAAFLPLGLYGIEKGFSTKKIRYFLLLTLSFVISFFSGHIQTSVYVATFLLAYVLYRSITSNNKKLIFSVLSFYLVGVIISLIQVIPTFELYQSAVRSSSLNQGGAIPLKYLVTIFAPDFYGNPVTRNDWFGTYAEWSSFIGIIPLFLAVFASLKRQKETFFFIVASLVTLLLAIDTPLQKLLVASHIPVVATSIPSRIIVLFSFSAAILASFGLDIFLTVIGDRKWKKTLPLFAVFALVIFLIGLSVTIFHAFPVDKDKIAQKNLILPIVFLGVLFIISILQKLLKKHIPIFVIAGVILLLISFDSLRFAMKWMPYDPRNLVFPDVPVIKAMQEKVGNGRVFGNIGTEVSTYYGLPSLEGYDPLYIQRYGELVRYAIDGTFYEAERSVVQIARTGKYTARLLDLLGVTVIYHPLADTNQSWAYPVWKDYARYSVIYQDNTFQLYRNNTALPRVNVYTNFEVITDKQAILHRLFDNSFDMKKTIILEQRPHITSIKNDNINNSAKIISYTPDKIIIDVKTKIPALLFLSDSYYPHWHAIVNGVEKHIYRADYALRAVEIPAGTSQVMFIYK